MIAIDAVALDQQAKLDDLLRLTLANINRVEPRHPSYNAANDPYRLVGALPQLELRGYSSPFIGLGLWGSMIDAFLNSSKTPPE